jgi:hypothetical protein
MTAIDIQQSIKEIINQWNPIDIYPLLDDEYEVEINIILDQILDQYQNRNNRNNISDVIFKTFSDVFGEKLFSKTLEDCLEISNLVFGAINMTSFPQDIINKLRMDFSQDYDLVLELLSDWVTEMKAIYGTFEEIRITRCIVYYANGDLNRLNDGIKLAKTDWRDTIVMAEFDEDLKQVRDMNKPFIST